MKRWVAVVLWLVAICSYAQEVHWEVSAGAEYMLTAYSFRSPHNTVGLSMDVAWWQRAESYSYGLKANVGILPEGICGHRVGLLGMLRLPLGSWIDGDMGLGLSTYTNPLPRSGDTNNVYISTWLTYFIEMGLTARIAPNWQAGLRLVHSSNGHICRPNRGLNFFRFDVGYRMPLHQRQPRERLQAPNIQVQSHHALGITFSWGLTASRHSQQQGVYPCYDLSLCYVRYTDLRIGYGGMIDLWYNFSHVWQLPLYYDSYRFPLYVGALGFLEWSVGPFSIRGGVGYTLLRSSRVQRPIYEHLAVYYHVGKHYAGVGINAHVGQAEFVEWSYGFWLPLPSARTHPAEWS